MAVRPPRSKNPALNSKLKELDNQIGRQPQPPKSSPPKKVEPAKSKAPSSKQESGAEKAPKAEVFSVGRLAADQRVNMARGRGFQASTEVNDYILAKQEVSTGLGLAETLHQSQSSDNEYDEEEKEFQPEEFLSAFEAMKDVYLKVHGRASPKTRQLLEGIDLEDLVKMVQELNLDDELRRSSEARLKNSIFAILKDEPGPLLLGLNDKRLLEPWKLFLEGWDIWVPEVDSEVEDAEASGVELFWEGEAEDPSGKEIQITQTLSFESMRVKLRTQFGLETDELSFDGQTFFRLKKR